MTEWIVSSSALILGVLALRKALQGRISLRLQYALWLVVLLRLLTPVNLFQSSISIQNAVAPIQLPPVQMEVTPQSPVSPPAQQAPVVIIPQNPVQNENVSDTPVQTPDQSPVITPQSDPTVNEPIEWLRLLTNVWIFGGVAMLSFILGANIQFSRMLSKNRIGLDVPSTPVPVYISTAVKTPCLVGVFRPVIYLTPEVADNPACWDHVICHELTHMDHFDHVFSFLRCLVLSIHWFNPLVWIAARVSKDDCELACDEGTISRLGEGERIPYGQTLIRMTTRSTNPTDLMIAATTMLGSKSAIRQRITLIAKRPRTIAAALVVCVTVVAVLVGCTFTGAVDPTEPEETIPETTAPMETTAPSAPPETTQAPAQVVPLGYVDLAELLNGTSITMTVDGDIVYLQEDGLTLTLVKDSGYIYRNGYVMRSLGRPLKVDGENVYIQKDFLDFLTSREQDDLSLFHGCYFFATEVIQALEAPIQTEFTRKLLLEVTDPSSMGITLPRLDPGRVLQTQTERNINQSIQADLRAMGLPQRYALTYTEYNEISGGITWRDYDSNSGYEELDEERKAFLTEKQIYYYDHFALMQAFGWEYMERSDAELRSVLEQDYMVDHEFIRGWKQETDPGIPTVEINVDNFMGSLIAYGGTIRHSDDERVYTIHTTNRQNMLGGAINSYDWTLQSQAEELPDRYVELSDGRGHWIRFYDVGAGYAVLNLGQEEQLWKAKASYDHATSFFVEVQQFYYSNATHPGNYMVEADTPEEAMERMGQLIAERHLDAMEDSPYFALESVILDAAVERQEQDWAEGWVYYAIRQSEFSTDGYGNVDEGTGEYEGWLMINQWYCVVRLPDGTWTYAPA
ncbi:MAG: hypothetical protein IJ960_06635 [Oscillospiraceae bacterium]|nr:hypothetical protein [Oscillospiraceae bacterium]